MKLTVRKSIVIITGVALAIILALKFYPRLTSHVVEIDLLSEAGISDGPYVFFDNKTTSVQWISNDSLFKLESKPSDYIHIGEGVDFKFQPKQLLALNSRPENQYDQVDKIATLSDIHGQYELYIQLLEANHIIDAKGNWSYGKGHLVIIGDAFDRGEKVTETLWHILKLRQQADKAGGKVHYLLGNHDVMVLNGDLRYIHDKYKTVAEQTGLSYAQLFAHNSLMGQWLRNCPVVLRINNIIFNHAGLSMAMVNSGQTIDKINNTFSTSIIDNNKDSIRASEELSLLARSQGPIWYRGYFRDTTLTNASIDSILHHFNVNHIVVGHTSMEQVEVLFDKRILAADTSIKRGENGELLIIDNNRFYRAGLDGKKELLW
ncbi:metallophosphoesterase [Carboxylicivirga sp. A043]|uniref:metallophosphoesterase n=1 Tax=Carboxylicivirga litoralis TaxID=2816963 RepID=UPI0021CB6BB2|nr:metallophosphoesterase [Carboxylicivirga sp. A043]MCU4156187.1 metallophosphoesterase [Carboxylicivirga sp. A043]